MSAASPSLSDRDLLKSIRPFRRRMAGLDLGQLCLTFVAAVLMALLSLMWFDTVVALPAGVRWGATRAGLLVAGAALVARAWWMGRALTHEYVAKRIDHSIGSGGEVLAGLQLATKPVQPAGELSHGMARIAAQRAVDRVQALAPSVVGDWHVLKTPALFLVAVVASLACISGLVPGIAWNQVQRFLFPSADIPPYTGILIDLTLEKEGVLYGQDALVSATVQAGKVDSMTLVVKTEGGQEQLLPMLAQSESQWQAILTRVQEPLTLYARSGSSRSRLHRLDVRMTPQLQSVKVTVTPPAYTRAGVYRGAIPEKGLVGLAGTEVAWEAVSNRPLSTGRLLLSYRGGTSEQIELKPKADQDPEDLNTVVGAMQLSRPGQFELSVVDIDGVESADKVTGSITILEDGRPVVRIVSPQQVSLATPDIKLPVVVSAEDDYGITSLTLFRSLNGSPASPVSAQVEVSPRIENRWELPLPSFGLVPGDEIHLFARTEDNDPAGAKGAESPVTTIKIISIQEFQEMMVQRRGAESIQAKYQAARRYFDQLASALREAQEAQEALEKAQEADPNSAETANAAEALQQKLDAAKLAATEAAKEIQKLSEQPLPIDVDRELAKRLEAMSQQAGEMAQQLGEMKEAAQPGLNEQDQQELEEMIAKSGEAQKKLTDDAIEPLKKMQQLMPLVIDQQRFTQIDQQQRDLAKRLQGLQDSNAKDAATQRRVAELESEQEQLRQQLEQLLDAIEQHAQDLPEDPELDQLRETALKFTDAVRESEANPTMSAAQKDLLSNKFGDAQQNAETAAEILESFLSKSNGMGEKACENCKAAFNPSAGGANLGDSIKQMLAMMGMKPGASGMKPGGSPGMGMGFGAGGGVAQRFSGPQNVGLYGSLPTAQQSPSRGRGDKQSQGVQTSQAIDAEAVGAASGESQSSGEASGQGMSSIPANYRSKVAEYFRSLSDQIGAAEQEGGK